MVQILYLSGCHYLPLLWECPTTAKVLITHMNMSICQTINNVLLAGYCVYQGSFWIGGAMGLVAAFVGALIDFRVTWNRREDAQVRRLPGCMMLVAGVMGGAGVFSILLALFTHQAVRAILVGLGLIGGFFVGFTILVCLWLLWLRFSD